MLLFSDSTVMRSFNKNGKNHTCNEVLTIVDGLRTILYNRGLNAYRFGG
jgi:hypothetical protein